MKKRFKSILNLLVALPIVLSFETSHATPTDSIKYKLAIVSGMRILMCDSLPATTNLDLSNTIMDDEPTAYLGLNLDINWRPKLSTSISFLIVDSYFLSNIKLTTQYFITEYLGARAGYYSFDYFLENEMNYFIDNYNEFFSRTITDPFIYEDDNFFQDRIREKGFIVGPIFRLQKPRFAFRLHLNWGLTCLDNYKLEFVAKEHNSNKKQKISLATTKNKSPFFFPEFELEYQFLQKRKMNLAIQIHGNFYYQDKKMNYEKRVFEWTSSSIDRLLVYNPQHRFLKYELGLGIIFAW